MERVRRARTKLKTENNGEWDAEMQRKFYGICLCYQITWNKIVDSDFKNQFEFFLKWFSTFQDFFVKCIARSKFSFGNITFAIVPFQHGALLNMPQVMQIVYG